MDPQTTRPPWRYPGRLRILDFSWPQWKRYRIRAYGNTFLLYCGEFAGGKVGPYLLRPLSGAKYVVLAEGS